MTRQLPLHEAHRRLGATFAECREWMVPLHYGDPLAEHHVVRHSIGLLDRSHEGRVEVTGRDRVSFLHGMLTNDVKALASGQGSDAAFLDNHGRVQALLSVYACEDRLLLALPPGLVEKTLALLDKFLISERVEFRDMTETMGSLSLEGPESAKLLAELIGEPLSLTAGQHLERTVDGIPIRLIGRSETGEAGVQLWTGAEHLPSLWSRLIERGGPVLKPVGESALNTLRIEAGLPWYPDDVNQDVLFMEAPLESLVSYTKGCYIGQEVVARIKYRGHVNRRLVGFTVLNDRVPPQGAQALHDGKTVGRITSSVFSPTLKRPIALGYLRREVDLGATVELQADTERFNATVTALPFYQH